MYSLADGTERIVNTVRVNGELVQEVELECKAIKYSQNDFENIGAFYSKKGEAIFTFGKNEYI